MERVILKVILRCKHIFDCSYFLVMGSHDSLGMLTCALGFFVDLYYIGSKPSLLDPAVDPIKHDSNFFNFKKFTSLPTSVFCPQCIWYILVWYLIIGNWQVLCLKMVCLFLFMFLVYLTSILKPVQLFFGRGKNLKVFELST